MWAVRQWRALAGRRETHSDKQSVGLRCREPRGDGGLLADGVSSVRKVSEASRVDDCHGSSWSGKAGDGGQALGPVRLGGSQWCVSIWGTVSCLSLCLCMRDSLSGSPCLPCVTKVQWLGSATCEPLAHVSPVSSGLPSHWLMCPLCPHLLVSPAPHANFVTVSLSPPRKVTLVPGRPLCPPP